MFRKENPIGENPYLYNGTSLDKRYPQERVMSFEDGRCQMHFKEGIGYYPYRIYKLEIKLTIHKQCGTGDLYALAIWNKPQFKTVKTDLAAKHMKTYDGNHLILFKLEEGDFCIEVD